MLDELICSFQEKLLGFFTNVIKLLRLFFRHNCDDCNFDFRNLNSNQITASYSSFFRFTKMPEVRGGPGGRSQVLDWI